MECNYNDYRKSKRTNVFRQADIKVNALNGLFEAFFDFVKGKFKMLKCLTNLFKRNKIKGLKSIHDFVLRGRLQCIFC